VRALLGEGAPSDEDSDLQARLDTIEPALAAAEGRVFPLTEALRRLELREPEIRAAALMDLRASARVIEDAVVIEMARCLQEAARWNAQLVQLESYRLGSVRVGSWRELTETRQGPSRLATWLRTAREAGVDA
jgi:hypothetical protein